MVGAAKVISVHKSDVGHPGAQRAELNSVTGADTSGLVAECACPLLW